MLVDREEETVRVELKVSAYTKLTQAVSDSQSLSNTVCSMILICTMISVDGVHYVKCPGIRARRT